MSSIPPFSGAQGVGPSDEADHVQQAGAAKVHASKTFDDVAFNSIQRDAHGALTADLSFGIKPPPSNDHSHPPPLGLRGIMTVHADARGHLTWEKHVDHAQAGRRHPMSDADRASLAKNLEKYLDDLAKIPPARLNPEQALWVKLLEYAKR